MSSFTWLDYSEADRRRALDVVSHFREQEARDELGIGAIRDTFSDLLFPGVSTIQTRARYFLFVPWIMRAAEGRGLGGTEMAEAVKRREIMLINSLIKGGETNGVIGIEARQTLKRHASDVYWHGLGTWGIREFQGSRSSYYAFVETYQPKGKKKVDWENEVGLAELAVSATSWHHCLPPMPKDFPWEATLELRPEDAEFLKDRILISPGSQRSMLAGMLALGKADDDARFPWDYDAQADLPDHVQLWLRHARLVSTLVYGALGLYHLLLARDLGREDLVGTFETTLADWADIEMGAAMPSFRAWDRDAFWRIVHEDGTASVSQAAASFLNSWWDMVLEGPSQTISSVAAENLIRDREYQLKRSRARLANPRALELWSGETRPYHIEYRWPVAKTIVADILNGLSDGTNDA